MKGVHFYGLLHLESNENSAVNIRTANFSDQIKVYLNNAILLSKSLKVVGIDFTLLTNCSELISSVVGPNHDEIIIRNIPFITQITSGIRFYSAHFKLDVFRYIADLNIDYAVFCDLDMVCVNRIPKVFINIVEQKIPLVYDITDQVIPTYGHDVIIRDLEKLILGKSEGRWLGGEFISGPPLFFSKLTKEIDYLLPNYLSNIENIHHIGDEAFTSSAIEIMRHKGAYIGDAGSIGIISRYWSSEVEHIQRSIDYHENCFLMHLPADKRFLSKLSTKNFLNFPVQFKSSYRNYIFLKGIFLFIRRLIFSLRGRTIK